MSFEDFELQARLYVLGALDEDELTRFEQLRHEFGSRAENTILECERLNSMFALSLKPSPPKPATKQRLLDMINSALNGHVKKPTGESGGRGK